MECTRLGRLGWVERPGRLEQILGMNGIDDASSDLQSDGGLVKGYEAFLIVTELFGLG